MLSGNLLVLHASASNGASLLLLSSSVREEYLGVFRRKQVPNQSKVRDVAQTRSKQSVTRVSSGAKGAAESRLDSACERDDADETSRCSFTTFLATQYYEEGGVPQTVFQTMPEVVIN